MQEQIFPHSDANNSESTPCHSTITRGNRRWLLQTGVGAAGLLLASPAMFWSRAAQGQGAQLRAANAGLSEAEELMVLALQHEHGAMVQYANHAGLLSHWVNPAFAATIQEIITDEVGHAVVLVNALIAAGVNPTLAVWPPRSASTARELVLLDVAAEQGAVEIYSQLLEYDLDPELRSRIAAIRDAEVLHRNIFNDLVEQV